MSSWLDQFLTAIGFVQNGGTPLIQRQTINFLGAGVSVSDDASTKTTNVTITAPAPGTSISAKVAATGNLALTGSQTIDGVSCTPGDVVLAPFQTAAAENGLWTVALGTWTRTPDAIVPGMIVFVQQGNTYQGAVFTLTTPSPISVGTTPLTFVRVTPVMNVRLFGAKGDGVTDDASAFTAGLTALTTIGGGTLYAPATPGSAYLIKSFLSLPSNVVINGDGMFATIIRATAGVAAPWTNVPGQGMIEMRGSISAGLTNLTVDGNSALRTFIGGDPITDAIDFLLILAGAQQCLVDGVRFTGAGYATASGFNPSGPVVAIIAKDTQADIGSQFGTVPLQDCSGNTIRNYQLDDAGGTTRCEKGIGIITDFGCRTAGGSPHNYNFNTSRRQTTIGGSVGSSATNILVADSHGFAIGDSIRIERAADSTLFDHGNVTAIPDSTHVTIDTPTSRTYAASDKFGTSRDALSPLGTGGAPSSALRGRAVDPAGSGRNGVVTTVSGSMSSSTTNVLVTSSEDIALGDTIQITRTADHTLFDRGVVTAIPDSTHVTIGTPTTRTYALNDIVTAYAFSAASGFNGGDYFVNHAQGNLIEDGMITGDFALYAIGIQGGGAKTNTVQRNRFNSVRALGLVLVDKGAYANDVLSNVGFDHQRDPVFLTGSPMASFVGRSVPSYYDTDNRFEGNKIYAFVGTIPTDAPFAVGEGAVRQRWIKNTVDGASVPSNNGIAFMIGQGDIDCEVSGNAVRGTDYGVFSNLGGSPAIPGSGCVISDNTFDVTRQGVQLTANAAAVVPWGGAVQIKRNRVSGTVTVSGQIAVDATIAIVLVHDNYVERLGTPGAGHTGLSIGSLSGVVGHNIAKNHDTAYSFTSAFQGLQHDNLAISSATKDVDFQVTKTPGFTRIQSSLPQATTRIVEVVSTSNIASMSGAVTIDGIAIPAGLDVLLTAQSTGSQNGVWTVQSGAWTRSYDLQAGAFAGGLIVVTKEGTTYHDTAWLCTNDTGADIVGTSSLTWSLVASATAYTGGIAAAAASALNLASTIPIRDGSGSFAMGVLTATDIDNAAATIIRVGNNTLTTAIGTAGGNLKVCGGTARTLPTRAGQLTDSSGGTSGGNTVGAIVGAVDPTAATVVSTANAVATLAAKINALEARMSNASLGVITQ